MSIKVVGKVAIVVPMMHGYCKKCGTVVEGPQGDWDYKGDQRDSYYSTDCPQCKAEIFGSKGVAPQNLRTKGGWQPCQE